MRRTGLTPSFSHRAGGLVAVVIVAGCYDVPMPACGFRCGPAAACPSNYTCAGDGFCHHAGSSPEQTCAPAILDAAVDAEDVAPFIVRVFPDDEGTHVATSAIITATFNEPIAGISSTTFTLMKRDVATPVAASVAYDPPTRTASLDPDAELDTGAFYRVALSPELTDLEGNRLTGAMTWAFFTIPDTTAPVLTMTSPINGATGVGVDSRLVATFTEQVSNITTATFFLEDPDGFVSGAIGYVSQTAVSFTPSFQLMPNTAYRASLTSTITDFGGNPLAGAPVTWTFVTGADTVHPLLVSSNPAESDSDVSLTTSVSARFSEPVIGVSSTSMRLAHPGGTVPAQVTYLPNTRTARLVPDQPLPANTTYTVILNSSITDLSGNSLPSAPIGWSFTTGS